MAIRVILFMQARRAITMLRRSLNFVRYTPLHPQYFAYKYERIRAKLAVSYCDGLILDVGCGRKSLLDYLPKGVNYVGLDYPPTSALYGGNPNVYSDAESLPFAEFAFDTVVCLEVLEHLKEPERALCEARRVLSSGGAVVISVPFLYPIHDAPNDFRRFTMHGIELMAESSNLSVASIHPFGAPLESAALHSNLAIAWQAMSVPFILKIPAMMAAFILIVLINTLTTMISLPLRKFNSGSPFAIGYLAVLKI